VIDKYAIYSALNKIVSDLALDSIDDSNAWLANYNASPTQKLPIIINGSKQLQTDFYWGGSSDVSKNKALSQKLINHSIAVNLSPNNKKLIDQHRCIVPADGFYQWKHVAKKERIPYYFQTQKTSLMYLAGTWEVFEDVEGRECKTFRILTHKINNPIDQFPHEYPVIFSIDSALEWLSPDNEFSIYLELIADSRNFRLVHYPVSPNIQYSGMNNADLILPTVPTDQLGNYTLFD